MNNTKKPKTNLVNKQPINGLLPGSGSCVSSPNLFLSILC